MKRYLCWTHKTMTLFGYREVSSWIYDEQTLDYIRKSDDENVYWYTDIPESYGSNLPLLGNDFDWALFNRVDPQNGKQSEISDILSVVRKSYRLFVLGGVHPSDRRRSSPSRFYHRHLRRRKRELRNKRTRSDRPDFLATIPDRVFSASRLPWTC